jgi:hypothetical protein
MSWSASTIIELYKDRWELEIFFRDIKQQLHTKYFVGTQSKCSNDTDMYNSKHHSYLKGAKNTRKISLLFIKLSRFYKVKSV